MLSKAELANIKCRLDQATPGPWVSFVENRDVFSGSDFIQTGGDDIYLTGATVADQDFIAHAREDIDKLINEVLRLNEELKNK